MNSHANAVKIGQQVTEAVKTELADNNSYPFLDESAQSNRRIAARGTAYRVLQNLWYDLFHVSVRARYDYVFDAYLKAIGWPE